MNKPVKKKQSRAESLYLTVKNMAIVFEFKPGERINEIALARRLGASRTPLREALNRLAAEGFLVTKQDRGFFCRELKPREMFELYQSRTILEVAAVRLACELATEQEVVDLADTLDHNTPAEGSLNINELEKLDEYFHEQIVRLSRNMELSRTLENINARIRYFRWVDMDSKRIKTQKDHRDIIKALIMRDADLAATLMEEHISRRLDQITAAIKESYSRIYLAS